MVNNESQFSFYNVRNMKHNRRAHSSICHLESEAIAEELEEYDLFNPSETELRPHYLPGRTRLDSSEL